MSKKKKPEPKILQITFPGGSIYLNNEEDLILIRDHLNTMFPLKKKKKSQKKK